METNPTNIMENNSADSPGGVLDSDGMDRGSGDEDGGSDTDEEDGDEEEQEDESGDTTSYGGDQGSTAQPDIRLCSILHTCM